MRSIKRCHAVCSSDMVRAQSPSDIEIDGWRYHSEAIEIERARVMVRDFSQIVLPTFSVFHAASRRLSLLSVAPKLRGQPRFLFQLSNARLKIMEIYFHNGPHQRP